MILILKAKIFNLPAFLIGHLSMTNFARFIAFMYWKVLIVKLILLFFEISFSFISGEEVLPFDKEDWVVCLI